MPELPEVETIRRDLAKAVIGQVIAGIEVRTTKSFPGKPATVIGQKIRKVSRLGKAIVIVLEKNRLLVHLKMTGRLIFIKNVASDYLKDKHSQVIFTFKSGDKLVFWDLRKFGWVKIDASWPVGTDPFDKEFTPAYLVRVLKTTSRPVKVALLDQQLIAGIGNIYASEALFCARIDPRTPGKTLSGEEERLRRLHGCILKVLQKAIDLKGSSDDSYRLLDGSKGEMQKHFQVYRQQNKPCPRHCGGVIKRLSLGGRGTFFCPQCQRL